jgi:hypothetical protein
VDFGESRVTYILIGEFLGVKFLSSKKVLFLSNQTYIHGAKIDEKGKLGKEKTAWIVLSFVIFMIFGLTNTANARLLTYINIRM